MRLGNDWEGEKTAPILIEGLSVITLNCRARRKVCRREEESIEPNAHALNRQIRRTGIFCLPFNFIQLPSVKNISIMFCDSWPSVALLDTRLLLVSFRKLMRKHSSSNSPNDSYQEVVFMVCDSEETLHEAQINFWLLKGTFTNVKTVVENLLWLKELCKCNCI